MGLTHRGGDKLLVPTARSVSEQIVLLFPVSSVSVVPSRTLRLGAPVTGEGEGLQQAGSIALSNRDGFLPFFSEGCLSCFYLFKILILFLLTMVRKKKSLISSPCALAAMLGKGACRKAELCLGENSCVVQSAQKPKLNAPR